jgi:hypothetical protein
VTLHLASFGGGIIRAGSPDAQQTSELARADALDIGLRGQLVAASGPSDYVTLNDFTAAPWSHLYYLGHGMFDNEPRGIAIGNGLDGVGPIYLFAYFSRDGAASPVPVGQVRSVGANHLGANPGVIATTEQFPGKNGGSEVLFLNLGAREGYDPNTAPGLYVFQRFRLANTWVMSAIQIFNALGTGANSKQLYFRGIAGYNNHVFGWGHDSADTANFDGPCRAMFCNPGEPFTWGNDNQGGGTPRSFTDSDAIVLGDAGEIIRGACKWNGRLYFGTNAQLHFIGGYGRDSFLTDGSTPVARSHNIVGAHAMVEGPDRVLYGVSDRGLWRMDPAHAIEPVGLKLIDFSGRSSGYWDLIWTDPTQLTAYPGKTNADLVWLVPDFESEQVIIGIPFCNAAAGYGYGTDTVIIKFHTRAGGFTRQVYAGVQYTAADWVQRQAQQREARFMGTATAGQVHVKRYAYQATQIAAPAMPNPLPDVEFGPFALYGPDGIGAIKRLYLTLAWGAATSLPIAFAVTVTGDEAVIDTFTLTIAAVAPGAPATGDVWLDTSESDTSLGNATAGATIGARGGYLARTYYRGAWQTMNTSTGRGARASVPLPIKRTRHSRVSYRFLCTAAAGRFQLEGLGSTPGGGKHDA